MGRSLGFGSAPYDSFAHFTLAFTAAAPLSGLTLPYRTTRRFIIQKVRRHPFPARRPGIGLRLRVGTRFQVLLTPLVGVLFIVQSPYWFTIGRQGVLSLGGWSPRIQTAFHGSGPTQELRSTGQRPFAYGTIALCGARFHSTSART